MNRWQGDLRIAGAPAFSCLQPEHAAASKAIGADQLVRIPEFAGEGCRRGEVDRVRDCRGDRDLRALFRRAEVPRPIYGLGTALAGRHPRVVGEPVRQGEPGA